MDRNSAWNRAFRFALAAALALLLGLGAIGCESDDDKDDDDELTAVFTADGRAGEGEIALADGGSEGGVLRVDVVAGGGFTDAYGLSFRLTYDREVIRFTEVTAGDALADGGVELLCLARENEADELIFGLSRADTFDGAALQAGDVFATLTFNARGAGTTRLDFVEERSRLADSRLEEIEVSAWKGGEVVVH